MFPSVSHHCCNAIRHVMLRQSTLLWQRTTGATIDRPITTLATPRLLVRAEQLRVETTASGGVAAGKEVKTAAYHARVHR